LSINQVVDINIYLSPVAAARNAFNLGCIIGTSDAITPAARVASFTSAKAMLEAGFAAEDPEYKAALLYFSQSPAPDKLIVGVKGESETWVQAFQAVRAANTEWYAFVPLTVLKADITALAAEVEAAQPSTTMFYTTADADILTATAGNAFLTFKGLNYRRSIGQYSTKSAYATAAIMGYAMGANTGLANSAYTLAFKREIGVEVENVTQTQYENIVNANGNVYVNRGGSYTIFQQGHMPDGSSFDEVINLDKLANDLQLTGMDTLYGQPKIPQTEDGMSYFLNNLQAPLEQAVKIGFIAPGKWTGPNLLDLSTNDFLSKGYRLMAEKMTDQAQADREARKAPNIYIPIKLAGAIEFVVIGVYVNR
jgi:hypothetical protein